MADDSNTLRAGIDNIDLEKAVDARVEITVSENKAKAYLFVSPPKNGGCTLDAELLEEAVSKAGIVFGIKKDVIEKVARLKTYGHKVMFAEAKPPVNGDPETIKYHFETSKSRRPKMLNDGTVDFKQIGYVKNVRQYDVLCSKTAATPGTPGTDVYGEEIPAMPGKVIEFKNGKNTLITRDGLTLCAALDGQVDIIGEKVEVREILEINGDIDFSTGNINYIGSVWIKGSVKSGFEVRAQGSVTILGSVEGAKVIAGGNIVIEQGFAGMNTGLIQTDGDLRCKYVQNGTVNCELGLETGMIVNSTVNVGASCKVLAKSSAVLSSHIVARHSIECVDVGSPTAAKESILEVGSDPKILKRSKEIPEEKDKILKRSKDIERSLFLFKQLDQVGRLSDDNREKNKKLSEELEALKNRQVELFYEEQEISQRLVSSGYGSITVSGKLFPGTKIIIGADQLTVDLPKGSVVYSRDVTGITSKPVVE